eukprot:gnl/TRDRNA2_/TRDRNA2_156495_c0_seq1.p1 gnl/TRDRNA2_/TRDRNA2_156495_c0~~gnl/TRDRNA2_/TRDRNA2_156495_c0_seq1.p1  ORF type:complete len:414 (+),score=48.38 gnl/TRDRNA2_/TRDRNA2_156495_c0_seq1:97-1338(+)
MICKLIAVILLCFVVDATAGESQQRSDNAGPAGRLPSTFTGRTLQSLRLRVDLENATLLKSHSNAPMLRLPRPASVCAGLCSHGLKYSYGRRLGKCPLKDKTCTALTLCDYCTEQEDKRIEAEEKQKQDTIQKSINDAVLRVQTGTPAAGTAEERSGPCEQLSQDADFDGAHMQDEEDEYDMNTTTTTFDIADCYWLRARHGWKKKYTTWFTTTPTTTTTTTSTTTTTPEPTEPPPTLPPLPDEPPPDEDDSEPLPPDEPPPDEPGRPPGEDDDGRGAQKRARIIPPPPPGGPRPPPPPPGGPPPPHGGPRGERIIPPPPPGAPRPPPPPPGGPPPPHGVSQGGVGPEGRTPPPPPPGGPPPLWPVPPSLFLAYDTVGIPAMLFTIISGLVCGAWIARLGLRFFCGAGVAHTH